MNLDFPVTRTKILIPRRRTELVTRQRLLDTLNELLDNKLMILAAPAGYGKTSLLIDSIHHSELPHCWYSLDTLDRDPQRFIAHFIASINLQFPKFGQEAAQALNNSNQDRLNVDALVTAITNDAYENIHEHFVIVLDDYHLVRESKQVDQFISRFIQDTDENCHLIIASRTLLTLPDLPLMVARSQVGGISFEELSFQPSEIRAFLSQNYKREINEEEAAEMARKTDGWITGLLLDTQLIGKEDENRQRVTRVSGVGLYEYLAQQVMEQQTPVMQEFLLRSSLLEEFDSEVCQEVIGQALGLEDQNWDEWIDILFHNNLFILQVGEERVYLRYHHLFRDFLRERMARQRPEETRRIQQRLAEVFVERQEWEQAFILLQRMGQMEQIADLAEKAGPWQVMHGQFKTLSDWLNTLPPELRNRRPALLSLLSTVTMTRGDASYGLELLNQALEMLDMVGDRYQTILALNRRSTCKRVLGEYGSALEDAERALEMASGDPSVALLEAEALRLKGTILQEQGQLTDALVWMGRALDKYEATRDDQNIARVCLEIGKVNEALGSYDASQRAYSRALRIWQQSGNTIWQANLNNNLGVLEHLLGNYEDAAMHLEQAVEGARKEVYPRMEAFALTSIGDLYRDLDAVTEAMDAYRWARLIAKQISDRFLLMYLDLAEASLARMRGQFFQAAELLASAQQMVEESQSPYEQHLCLMEGGCLKVARKDYQMAIRDLEEAARFFTSEGHRVEAIRANLYLVVAFQATGNRSRAGEYLTLLLSLASKPENRHPLITAGREVSAQLAAIAGKTEYGPQLNQLLDEVAELDERVPNIRKNLLRRALRAPYTSPKMTIRALGRMQVKIDDHVITSTEWQTQSCRDLFFLILAHAEGLTKEDVGAIFWPDASISELKLRFKNNVYRVRHAAGKEAIYFQEDYYYFNRHLNYEYDVESFLREITQAETARESNERLAHYQAAIKDYKGPYLPEIEETWVLSERERLHQMYLDTLLKVGEIYLKQKQYENALGHCQRALKEDPCLEAAHRQAMRIYAEMGSRAALVRQYDECRRALLEEIDAAPSLQTQELFESLMK